MNNQILDRNTKKNRYGWIIAVSVIVLIFILVTRLGYCQITEPKVYRSDTTGHMRFAREGKGYSYLIPVMGFLMELSGQYSDYAIAILNSIMVIATILAGIRWMKKYYNASDVWAFVVMIACTFLSSLYVPVLQPLLYLQGIVTQPWHNITYIGMRLFAVITLLGFGDTLQKYQKDFTIKQWLAIAIPLMIATGIKPSFLIPFSWTMLLYLIVDALKERFSKKTIIQCIKLGTSVFPAVLIMYLQSKVLYKAGGSSGIEVSLLSSTFFKNGFIGTIIKMMRGLLLPSLVYAFNRKKLGRKEWFVLVQFVVSLAVTIFLHETGPRANDGNFCWPMYCCGFLLFAVTLVLLAGNVREIYRNDKAATKDKIYLICSVVLALWHFVSGAAYFFMLNTASTYMI